MSGEYPRWQAVVYHDEPEDANTDNLVLANGSGFATEQDAIDAIRRRMADEPYWNGGGTVHIGTWYPGKLGVRPPRFEDDDDCEAKYVSPVDGSVE